MIISSTIHGPATAIPCIMNATEIRCFSRYASGVLSNYLLCFPAWGDLHCCCFIRWTSARLLSLSTQVQVFQRIGTQLDSFWKISAFQLLVFLSFIWIKLGEPLWGLLVWPYFYRREAALNNIILTLISRCLLLGSSCWIPNRLLIFLLRWGTACSLNHFLLSGDSVMLAWYLIAVLVLDLNLWG